METLILCFRMPLMKAYGLLVAFFFLFTLRAQTDFESKRALLIGANAAYSQIQGDWAEHFGDQFGIGATFGWKFRNNWLLTANGTFGFGGPINDQNAVLGTLLTDRGFLLNLNGNYATVTLYQRNVYGLIDLEKLLPFWNANVNSGPLMGLGAGYIWHWIRIDNAGNDSPVINGDYARGYDRFSQGPMLRQSLGYLYFSRNRRINFKLAFEFCQIFSRDQRGLYYPTGESISGSQTNFLYGLNLTWYIPIYQGGTQQEYYYD